MSLTTLFTFTASLSLFITSVNVFANEHALVVYTEEFPPYNFSYQNEITGINVQLVKRACKEIEIECVFEIYPWNRAMRMALKGPNTGIVSTARTGDREKHFNWVGPFMSGQNCIYKLASREDIDIIDIASASNYVMGASTDSAYDKVLSTLGFEDGNNLKRYDGKYSKVRPFAAQRVDLIVASAHSIEMQLATADLSLSDVVPVAKIDNTLLSGNYLAVHPAIDNEVVSRLQSALDKLFSSGAAQEIEFEYVKPIKMTTPKGIDEILWNACMKEDSHIGLSVNK